MCTCTYAKHCYTLHERNSSSDARARVVNFAGRRGAARARAYMYGYWPAVSHPVCILSAAPAKTLQDPLQILAFRPSANWLQMEMDNSPPPQYGAVSTGETAAATAVVMQPVPVAYFGPSGDERSEFRDVPVWIADEKGSRVQTELRYKNGLLTWIAMLILCLICSNFGLCLLCFVPLCMKSMKDVEHVNPADGSVVGRFHRIQH